MTATVTVTVTAIYRVRWKPNNRGRPVDQRGRLVDNRGRGIRAHNLDRSSSRGRGGGNSCGGRDIGGHCGWGLGCRFDVGGSDRVVISIIATLRPSFPILITVSTVGRIS